MQQGIQKGLQKGKQAKAREIATELLKNGFDVNLIQKATKLSIEEIEQLKKDL